jgi:ribosomal protein S18 acetylase RimI-like enzyme
MTFKIEPYRPEFLSDLHTICLLTGDNGLDSTHLYTDPNTPGDYFAAPYAIFEPDLTFVLTDEEGACGYVLGTRDSKAFETFMNTVWLPPLRAKYPITDSSLPSERWLLELIGEGYSVPENSELYPAHLHIDLLPRAQGHGMGRKIMTTFLNRLYELEIPGVHLGVGKRNLNAISFYEHLGFQKLEEHEFSMLYGMRLS